MGQNHSCLYDKSRNQETRGKALHFTFMQYLFSKFDKQAIYELWHGECDLIEDISMVQRNYHDSLVRLGLLNQSEADQIFGGIQSLLPVHTEVKEELTKAKRSDGSIEAVGNILLKWVWFLFNAKLESCNNSPFF